MIESSIHAPVSTYFEKAILIFFPFSLINSVIYKLSFKILYVKHLRS